MLGKAGRWQPLLQWGSQELASQQNTFLTRKECFGPILQQPQAQPLEQAVQALAASLLTTAASP